MNIIFGTAQLMQEYGLAKKNLKNNQLTKILSHARKNKFKLIDTALAYKNVDSVLSKHDLSKFNIITKVSNLQNNKTYKEIDNSRSDLSISKFHTVLLHDENELVNNQAKKNYKILKNLKLKKLTKYIGVSVYSKKKTLKIIENFKIDILQVPGNIFDRRFFDQEFLRLVNKKNIKIYFRSIFLQGTLLNKNLYKKAKMLKKSKLFKDYFEWIENQKVTPLEATFGYLNKIGIKNVIVGVSNYEEYKQIIKKKNYANDYKVPQFVANQNDKNYILRTDLWKK
jgi:aryl-alcohol dehydrogenase-like predicted oxidoreductase